MERSGSQAGGGLVTGWQSGGHGLDGGREVRQAGVRNRESDRAAGARRGSGSQAGEGVWSREDDRAGGG